MRILLFTALLTLSALAACQSANEIPANNGAKTSSGNQNTVKSMEPEQTKSEPDQTSSETGIDSIYTDLAEDKCEDVDINEEESWSVQSCGGVAGYQLLVSEGDLRQTIDIVAPDEKKYELNLWTVVSGDFSTVGDKAEWRVKKVDGKVKPFALIVRYNVSENPENADEVTSYLTVSKITEGKACVTDVVKPVRNANQKARELADSAATKPCLKKRS